MLKLEDYRTIELTREDRLLTVTLNPMKPVEPGARQISAELCQLWYEVAVDDSVGAIILTGTGPKTFWTGANVAAMGAAEKGAKDAGGPPPRRAGTSFVEPKRLIASLLEVEQPIVCALNGDAVGLGASVALNCDIIVANERARLADTHVKNLGVVAGDGGTVAWPLMMGIHKAKEYLLTGDLLLAADAARMGWINYALPGDEVMPKAREIALRLANGPQWAIRWTKTTVNKIARERLNLTMDTALALEWLAFVTEDHGEAVAAWNERRPGVFKGR